MSPERSRRRRLSRAQRLGLAAAVAIPAIGAGVAVFVISDEADVAPSQPPLISAESLRALEAGDDGLPLISRIDDRGRSAGDELDARALDPPAARPKRVAIPAAGLAIDVVPMRAEGERFRLPPPHVAGWYRGGPRPGEPGRAILVGHFDTKDGPGAFARLPEARPGDRLRIEAAGGKTLRYRVTEAVRVAKSTFAAATLYAPGRRPGVVLVTCGGRFDQRTGTYEDNVVVLATET